MLEFININKSYEGTKALDNVCLDINKGTIFGILGPNGAGKTTLIRIINRIIFQDSGKILWDGNGLNNDFVSKIGYLPEERGLYRKMKIGEQALFLSNLKISSRRKAREAVKFWFRKLEIESWLKKYPSELSKGMQQKVQFIISIMHNPEIVILDEPLSGLDPISAAQINKIILELRERGKTIIISTHNMKSVEQLCDDIALFNKSKIVLSGNKSEIKNKYKSGIYEVCSREMLKIEGLNNKLITENSSAFVYEVKSEHGIKSVINSIYDLDKLVEVKEKMPDIEEIFIQKIKEEDE